mmetsp:Transcript_44983/g.112769  ORF Transcript_44983/g.112769 Transcript_44983/m.112769 type:complete len:278 (+) Transcript_44983:129-962(+)
MMLARRACGLAGVGHRRLLSSGVSAPKAALLIIGDEVLKGTVEDKNTPWLAKKLYSRGVDLVRVEIVPDDRRDVGDTLGRLRDRVGPGGFVFTSGGIGPTHDDITYKAIAQASGRRLEVHEPTLSLMRTFYSKKDPPQELNEQRMRMATLPSDCEVLYTEGLWVPLCVVDRTYILPGIPRLFRAMIEGNQARFVGPERFFAHLFTQSLEGDLAAHLGEVADKNPNVQIGSYPGTAAGLDYRVKITLDGRRREQVESAMEGVRGSIPISRTTVSWGGA